MFLLGVQHFDGGPGRKAEGEGHRLAFACPESSEEAGWGNMSR